MERKKGGSTNTESSCGSLSSSHQSSAQHQEVLNEPLCSRHQLLRTLKRVAVSSGLQETHVPRETAKELCYNWHRMYNQIFIKMKAIVGFLNILPFASRRMCQLYQLALVQLWDKGEMYTVGHTERYTEAPPDWW